MIYTPQHLQKLYAGFCNTPTLWTEDDVFELKQLQIENCSDRFKKPQKRRLRLGQLAEQFVFNQIETTSNLELLAQNIQIQNQQLTVGELDAIIKMESKPIHLEIVYKFFLYDDKVADSGLGNWIGPNRRDSLMEKLEKLSEKQLPLLYSKFTRPYLEALKLKAVEISQFVIFKAQLFTPYNKIIHFSDLNPKAHYGHYFRLSQLMELQSQSVGGKFYIPKKIDWFLKPEVQVEWLSFKVFRNKAKDFLNEKRAFMFWMKRPNGLLSKNFLVWW